MCKGENTELKKIIFSFKVNGVDLKTSERTDYSQIYTGV